MHSARKTVDYFSFGSPRPYRTIRTVYALSSPVCLAPTMRLTRLFMMTTAILLVMVITMLARSMLQDWRTVNTARQGAQAIDLAYRSMKVAEKASAERGPTIPVLNDSVPPDPAKRRTLTDARAAADSAMAEALQGMAVAPGAPHQAALAQLR
jgi:hypothetical protein